MKRPVLAFVLILLLASVAAAQDTTADAPASKEDIQRYLDTIHTSDLMKKMINTMAAQMQQMMHNQIVKQNNLPPDAEARIDKAMDDAFKNFPVDDMLQAMIPVYQKYLTRGDVDALIAFYSTPVGQKMIAETPAMTADALKASSGIIQKMMSNEMQEMQDQLAQMEKENQTNSRGSSEGPTRN